MNVGNLHHLMFVICLINLLTSQTSQPLHIEITCCSPSNHACSKKKLIRWFWVCSLYFQIVILVYINNFNYRKPLLNLSPYILRTLNLNFTPEERDFYDALEKNAHTQFDQV
jgi:hypothetical protein